MTERTVFVRYYTCNCEWTSKYCDEFHQAGVSIPVSVLETYRNK